VRGRDDREVGEGLREVADHAPGAGVVLLGEVYRAVAGHQRRRLEIADERA
jgi:hypothetical protein